MNIYLILDLSILVILALLSDTIFSIITLPVVKVVCYYTALKHKLLPPPPITTIALGTSASNSAVPVIPLNANGSATETTNSIEINDGNKKDSDINVVNTNLNNRSFAKRLKTLVGSFYRYHQYRVSQIPSHHLRNFIYRHIYGVNMAKNAVIYYGAEIRSPFNVYVGEGSIIGDEAILDGRNGIVIGENVNFSSNVSIWTEQHDHRDPYFRCETQDKGPVRIMNYAWVGPNSIILHSVTIGEGAVVAAGSVVTKSVEPYTIVAGIPAKKIGERNRNLKYKFDGSHADFI